MSEHFAFKFWVIALLSVITLCSVYQTYVIYTAMTEYQNAKDEMNKSLKQIENLNYKI